MTIKVQVIKYFSIVILSFLALVSADSFEETHGVLKIKNSAQTVYEKDIVFAKKNGHAYFKGEPFSGKVVSHYADGTISSFISYEKGLKHGNYYKFFQDGSTSFHGKYVNGKPHGYAVSWWSNGNLRSKSNFVNGVGQGVQWQWYENGAKFKKIQLVNGREEGIQQSWRVNGKLYNNYEAKNGRIFGLKRSKLCFSLENEVVQR